MKKTYERTSTPKVTAVDATGLVNIGDDGYELHKCALPPMAEINAILRDESQLAENKDAARIRQTQIKEF
jgi:hypothetical protein